MVVSLKLGKHPLSYKPPMPVPAPKESLFPIQKIIKPDWKIWISVPLPDKLTIVGDLLPEHFQFDSEIEKYGPWLMSHLASGALGKKLKNTAQTQNKTHYWLAEWELGDRSSLVRFQLIKPKPKSPAFNTLRIEFNPRKLGDVGAFDLLETMEQTTGGEFSFGGFLADAHITRIDVAVDIVGIGVPDLLVSVHGAGKRVYYHGPDGVLESVYVYGTKKPSAKTTGPGTLKVKVYDRVREHAGMGKPPPFGPAPVTRIEVVKAHHGGKLLKLANLAEMSNPFSKIRVGSVLNSSPGSTWRWLEYVDLHRSGGPARAKTHLPFEADKFEDALAGHKSDILDAKLTWADWPQGLTTTYLDLLVISAQNPNASFLLVTAIAANSLDKDE